jgi:hypothetical protein
MRRVIIRQMYWLGLAMSSCSLEHEALEELSSARGCRELQGHVDVDVAGGSVENLSWTVKYQHRAPPTGDRCLELELGRHGVGYGGCLHDQNSHLIEAAREKEHLGVRGGRESRTQSQFDPGNHIRKQIPAGVPHAHSVEIMVADLECPSSGLVSKQLVDQPSQTLENFILRHGKSHCGTIFFSSASFHAQYLASSFSG